MTNTSIYKDIATRTDGSIFLGVVDPVRTGKSTFIKRFMNQLVLPNIEGDFQRERANDELPQASSSKGHSRLSSLIFLEYKQMPFRYIRKGIIFLKNYFHGVVPTTANLPYLKPFYLLGFEWF